MSTHASPWSAEARVLWAPSSVFHELAGDQSGRARLRRGPWLLVFALGCVVSMLGSGRFSVRLIVDGAMSFAFVPVWGVAAFAAVYRIDVRRRLPFTRAFDLFCIGYAPWLLWLVALVILGATVPARQQGPVLLVLEITALVPIVWSASRLSGVLGLIGLVFGARARRQVVSEGGVHD